MSDQEITSIREDIAELRAIVEERARSAQGNASTLRTISAAIIIQVCLTIYFAGAKTQMLDRLSQDVATIQFQLAKK